MHRDSEHLYLTDPLCAPEYREVGGVSLKLLPHSVLLVSHIIILYCLFIHSTTLFNVGEIGHGDATDDELLKEDHNTVTPEPVCQRSKSTLPLPRPLVKKSSITMDMLVSGVVS